LIFDLLTERSEPTEPIFGINKSHVNLVSVIRKIGSDRSDRSVPHQKVNCVVILKFMYHTAALTTWTARKQKWASRLERAKQVEEPRQEKKDGKQLEELRKLKKSLSATAHL
jgi:hypothetical protein